MIPKIKQSCVDRPCQWCVAVSRTAPSQISWFAAPQTSDQSPLSSKHRTRDTTFCVRQQLWTQSSPSEISDSVRRRWKQRKQRTFSLQLLRGSCQAIWVSEVNMRHLINKSFPTIGNFCFAWWTMLLKKFLSSHEFSVILSRKWDVTVLFSMELATLPFLKLVKSVIALNTHTHSTLASLACAF